MGVLDAVAHISRLSCGKSTQDVVLRLVIALVIQVDECSLDFWKFLEVDL